MSIDFYYGSGSPFAWTVWLALEHKQLPYTLHLLSFQAGDLRQPDYLAINPRGKVPALADGDFRLWETAVILEYLEQRQPYPSLLPADPHEKANARRLVAEAYNYLYPALRQLLDQTLFKKGSPDANLVQQALDGLIGEMAYFEAALRGDYFVGALSAADLAVYPILALLRRIDVRQPQHAAGALIGPGLAGFMQRIESLPYFAKTYPPHWKN